MCKKQETATSMLHVVEQDFTFSDLEKAEAQQLVVAALETYDEEEADASN